MNIRSKVKVRVTGSLGLGLELGLGDRVAGVSNALLSSAPLVDAANRLTVNNKDAFWLHVVTWSLNSS